MPCYCTAHNRFPAAPLSESCALNRSGSKYRAQRAHPLEINLIRKIWRRTSHADSFERHGRNCNYGQAPRHAIATLNSEILHRLLRPVGRLISRRRRCLSASRAARISDSRGGLRSDALAQAPLACSFTELSSPLNSDTLARAGPPKVTFTSLLFFLYKPTTLPRDWVAE